MLWKQTCAMELLSRRNSLLHSWWMSRWRVSMFDLASPGWNTSAIASWTLLRDCNNRGTSRDMLSAALGRLFEAPYWPLSFLCCAQTWTKVVFSECVHKHSREAASRPFDLLLPGVYAPSDRNIPCYVYIIFQFAASIFRRDIRGT